MFLGLKTSSNSPTEAGKIVTESFVLPLHCCETILTFDHVQDGCESYLWSALLDIMSCVITKSGFLFFLIAVFLSILVSSTTLNVFTSQEVLVHVFKSISKVQDVGSCVIVTDIICIVSVILPFHSEKDAEYRCQNFVSNRLKSFLNQLI